MKNKPIPRGRNGGRPLTYNEETMVLSFRVPKSLKSTIQGIVNDILSGAKISKNG